MKVTYERFQRSAGRPLRGFKKAAAFASELKSERLISISHDAGFVVIWYWE